MNKKLLTLVGVVLILLLAGCEREVFTPTASQMYGKWLSGSTYYRFDTNYWDYMIQDSTTVKVNGARWDTSDDVTDEEAQPFKWTLSGNSITIVHQMYMGGAVPKTYTVKSIVGNRMIWVDTYGRQTILNKQ